MGTITQKLTYLNETKNQIRAKINETSDMVNDTTTFREYSTCIGTLNKAYNPFLDKIGYSYSRCEKALNKPLKVAYKSGYLKQEGIPTPDTPQEIEVYDGVENLFDKDDTNITDNKYLDNQGAIASNNNFYVSDYKEIKQNTIYSVQPYQNYSACYCFYDVNKTFISSIKIGNINPNFTTPNNCKYIRYSVRKSDVDLLQIEENDTPHPYVPYKNDKYDETNTDLYPYHTNYALIKNSGKNLFDGKFRQGNTMYLTTANRIFSTNSVFLEANKTYCISTDLLLSSFKFTIRVSATKFPSEASIYSPSWSANNSMVYTPTQDCYLGILVSKSDTNANISVSDISSYRFMVEENTTASEIEPYREPAYTRIPLNNNFLAKIGDVKDEIDLVSGELRKRIGKFDLSTISWSYAGHNIENYKRYYTNRIDNIKYVSSNTEIGNGRADDYLITKGKGITSLTNVIAIDTSIVSVCSILSPTGLFYYELATPQTIQLGNSTIPMFNGTNILSLENDLENTFGITYFKD